MNKDSHILLVLRNTPWNTRMSQWRGFSKCSRQSAEALHGLHSKEKAIALGKSPEEKLQPWQTLKLNLC